MLLTLKRIFRLLPVLLLIMTAILFSAYREHISASLSPILTSLNVVKKLEEALNNSEFDKIHDVFMKNTPEDTKIMFHSSGGHEITVTAEVADSPEERTRGLMYRESLCTDCGMLFLFDSDQEGGFWMKNCEISLDVIFINANKEIVDIERKAQSCASESCPSYRSEKPYKYVVEVNGEWAAEHGVDVGDSVSW